MKSMIKTIWTALSILVWVNLVGLVGFVVWLHFSGRLSHERVSQIREILTPTVEGVEKMNAEQAAVVTEPVAGSELDEMGLSETATVEDQIERDQQGEELAQHKIGRLQRNVNDLQRQLEFAKRVYLKKLSEASSQQETREEVVVEPPKPEDPAAFQRAVKMYEQVKSKQAKEMFQELIKGDQIDQVVDYLAAMQARKAAAVLKEFKTPSEITQATDLIQRLRKRGADPMAGGSSAGDMARKTS
jgi:hypothetical protein